jgi:hypothetical protein
MPSAAFTVPIPADRVQELRDLLAELRKDASGLVDRARAVGYHRERMWLQAHPDGSASLITYLEFDEGEDPGEVAARVRAYESDFTAWWNPRYQSFLGTGPRRSETLFSWDDDGV